MADENKKVVLDGQEITYEELQEATSNLKANEKIVETSKGTFEKILRMNG